VAAAASPRLKAMGTPTSTVTTKVRPRTVSTDAS
jgi:hypothetical protein